MEFMNVVIDKKKIVGDLLDKLNFELKEIEKAAQAAHELATQGDVKSEGKYDTRAIEASYLAGAQAKRVEEIKLDIQMLEDINIDLPASKQMQLGSLGLFSCNGQDRLYFLSSTSGGTILVQNNHTILIISVFSPIGDAALGLSVGDSFEVETPKEVREYHIKEIH